MGGGGVTRIVKFCKYLPYCNWKPIALTVKNFDIPLHDTTLLKEVCKTRIHRTHAIDLALVYNKTIKGRKRKKHSFVCNDVKKESGLTDIIKKVVHNFIFIPDSRIGWLPFAVHKGLRISQKENIDLIFSTGGPWTNHLIGYLLKVFTKIPWIADFRDPWTENVLFPYSSGLKKIIDEKLEKAVVLKADKIITTTDSIANDLKTKHLQKNSQKYYTITNGYDGEEFQNPTTSHSSKNGKFIMAYTGNFYSLRTPKYFLKALALLFKEKPLMSKDIEVIFAGHWENYDAKKIKELNLDKVIKYIGFVSRPQVISLLSSCNVVLHIDANELKYIYALKIFDYFASNKPILALIPKDGIAFELIKSTQTGVAVDPENIIEVKEEILRLYRQFKHGELEYNPDISAVRQFDRKRLTESLSTIFDQTIRHSI